MPFSSATDADGVTAPLIDGGIYRVHVVNATTIQLKRSDLLTTQVNYVRSAGGDQIIRTDGNNWIDSGFGTSFNEELLITSSPVRGRR